MRQHYWLLGVFTLVALSSCGGNTTVTLTVEAQVAPATNPNPATLKAQTAGEAGCLFSCDVSLSNAAEGTILFEKSSSHVLSCDAQGVPEAQSFQVFNEELNKELFASRVLVEVNCTQDISGSFNVDSLLRVIYFGEAPLDPNGQAAQSVQVKITSLLDLILLGLTPEQAFDLANCSTLRFLDFFLTLNCPAVGMIPPQPPEHVPGPGCGKGELETGEECDFDPSPCSDIPIFECVPPGEEGECSCDFNSCILLPFVKDEVLFNCSTSPKCGDNICNFELGEPRNCEQDCHCGDSNLQADLGEQCEFGPQGPFGCSPDQDCGNPGVSLACQCVPIVSCGAGRIRCAPGSGVGCVVPCDGIEDCPVDGLDEANCLDCPPGSIACDEGSCAVSCDGVDECEGLDEDEFFCGPD